MVSCDPVINESLTVSVAWEQARTRKSSTICARSSSICECSGNFLNIIVSGDPVVNEALTVSVA